MRFNLASCSHFSLFSIKISLLSGIVFAYLKITKYFKNLPTRLHESQERKKKDLLKMIYFRVFSVCAWADFLGFHHYCNFETAQ